MIASDQTGADPCRGDAVLLKGAEMDVPALHSARARLIAWRDAGQLFGERPAWVVVEAQPDFASLRDALRLLVRPVDLASVAVAVMVPLCDAATGETFFARLGPWRAPTSELFPVLAGALRRRHLHDLRHRHLRDALIENLMVLALTAALAIGFRNLGGPALLASPLLLVPPLFDLLRVRDALRAARVEVRVDLDLSAQEQLDDFFAAGPPTTPADATLWPTERPQPAGPASTVKGA